MNIGIRIKNRREDLKMSAEELGNKIGKAKTTIYRYETGAIENMPSTVLEPIAKALRTTPAYLMGWTDQHDSNKQNYADYPNNGGNMISIEEKLKNFILSNYKSILDFTKSIEMPYSTMDSIFKRGLSNANISNVLKVCKALGISADSLAYGEITIVNGLQSGDFCNIIPLPETALIPLVGTIACGTPTLAVENIDEYIKADKSIKATFALRCKGDSMINARIFDGDIVYIHQQADIENGEIAAVLIDNEATLKRVFKYKDRLELRAENPMYQPLNIEGETLNSIRILGKAVAFFSTIR